MGEVLGEFQDGGLVCEVESVGVDVWVGGFDGVDVEGEDFRGGLGAIGFDEGGAEAGGGACYEDCWHWWL